MVTDGGAPAVQLRHYKQTAAFLIFSAVAIVVISGVFATQELRNNQGLTFDDENNQNLNVNLKTSEWNPIT